MSDTQKTGQETDRDVSEQAIRRVADAVHRMNEAIRGAIDTGVSVELVRASRFHDGAGNWGDQMIPMIRQLDRSNAR